jgi:hypothetical protein
MNQVSDGRNLTTVEVRSNGMLTKPAWVKPALERLSLKDALGGDTSKTSDCTNPSSGS